MEKLDRNFQLEILKVAADHYPQMLYVHDGELAGRGGSEVSVNCAYLQEHGLLDVKWLGTMDMGMSILHVRATAKGLDFLANDGGLSAILGVITIRLDTAQLREIFAQRVQKAPGDETTKQKVLAEIKNMPAEGLKELASKAMSAGLEHLPDLVHVLGTWLGIQ